MVKVKLWLGVFLVFILGILAGFLGSSIVVKHRLKKFVKEGPPPLFFLKSLPAELDLDPTRQMEIEKILDQSRQELEALREKHFPQLKAIFDSSIKKIKAKLSTEQKKKFDAMMKDHRFFPPEPPPPFFEKKHAGKILADIIAQLNLSQEQTEQVRMIIEESITKRHKIFEKHPPSPDYPDISQLRSEMDELDTYTEKRLAEILSPQQMEKYRGIHKEHRAMGPGWDRPRHGPFD
jgi:hypothetical protein